MVKKLSPTRTGTPERNDSARVDLNEQTDVRRGVERSMAERAASERAADTADNERIAAERARIGRPEEPDRTPDMARTEEMERADIDRERERERAAALAAPAGPKPRASLLATSSLMIGTTAALFVLSGLLAGWGVALGAIATLLGLGGIFGTRRRHVAGKTDALIGLLLGLGAVVVGVVALTESWSWLTADTNMVQRFRDWLDTQFVNRF